MHWVVGWYVVKVALGSMGVSVEHSQFNDQIMNRSLRIYYKYRHHPVNKVHTHKCLPLMHIIIPLALSIGGVQGGMHECKYRGSWQGSNGGEQLGTN